MLSYLYFIICEFFLHMIIMTVSNERDFLVYFITFHCEFIFQGILFLLTLFPIQWFFGCFIQLPVLFGPIKLLVRVGSQSFLFVLLFLLNDLVENLMISLFPFSKKYINRHLRTILFITQEVCRQLKAQSLILKEYLDFWLRTLG